MQKPSTLPPPQGYKVFYTDKPGQAIFFWDQQELVPPADPDKVKKGLSATIMDLKTNETYLITVVVQEWEVRKVNSCMVHLSMIC